MTDTTLFYVLIFVATVLFTFSVYSYFVQPMTANRKVNRRLAVIQSGSGGAQSLDLLRRERWLTSDRYRENLSYFRTLLVQSGVRAAPAQMLAAVALVGVVTFTLLTMVDGITLISVGGTIAAVVLLPLVYLQRARKARIQKFGTQIPDVIDLIVRSLKAGHPLQVALSLAAREMPDPAGTEFGLVADEIQFGASVPDAIGNMSYRVGDPDLDYLLTCITVQSQSGGNLGEVLARLARLMRERFRLARKVRALTSEARFSAIVLSLFPIILFGLMNLLSPTYYGEVWHLPSFHQALMVCGVLLFVGNAVMRRLADIKY